MQPAAFLCVICAICGRIYIQTYSINIHRRNPNVSRWSRRFTQTKPQNNKTSFTSNETVFLCEIMQPAAFLCVICVICGRIFTQEYSIYLHRRNPNISPADLADLRREIQLRETILFCCAQVYDMTITFIDCNIITCRKHIPTICCINTPDITIL